MNLTTKLIQFEITLEIENGDGFEDDDIAVEEDKQPFHFPPLLGTLIVYKYMEQNTTMQEMVRDFNQQIKTQLEKYFIDNGKDPKLYIDEEMLYIHYNYIPINNLEDECRLSFDFRLKDPHKFFTIVCLINPSDDARELFGDIFHDQYFGFKVKISTRIWEKSSLLVRASFANVDQHNFLGYTRNYSYTPIKFYKITSTDQKFWLDFYSSRDHRCPVVFPYTKIKNPETNEVMFEEPMCNVMMEAVLSSNSELMI
jgi:hypothetical protein